MARSTGGNLWRLWYAGGALLAVTVCTTIAAAQEATIVRGRVLGPLDVPIPNALVEITAVGSQSVRTARSDSVGVYAALFASGDAEYVIVIRALGYVPRTVRAARGGEAAILVADVRLEFVQLTFGPLELDTVTTAASVPSRPLPRPRDQYSVGTNERDATSGMLFTVDASDLVAVALSLPGVLPVMNASRDTTGFSVLGVPPEQNNTIVDGSTFAGRTLPRDAIASVRVATTPFDPGRGGFSGAQISATTRGGTDESQGTARTTAAEPQLSWSDPASGVTVPSARTISASIGGPIRRRTAHYFAATEIHVRSTRLQSLIAPRQADLAQQGLSADSVTAVRSALSGLNVPLTAAGVPRSRGDTRASAFLRIDVTPSATTSLTVRLDGTRNDGNGHGVSPLTYPSLASQNRSSRAGIQMSGSAYVGNLLDEAQTYFERTRRTVSPYVPLPTGSVRVGVGYPDGREGLTTLRFGGALAQTESETARWETRNEVSWLSGDTTHRLKLGQSFTMERTVVSEENGRFGTYTYATIADLANNRPTSYARRFSARTRSSGVVIGAAWAGDEWRASNALRIQYGARLDVITPTNAPEYNAAVDTLFAARTDRLPTDVGLSPRLGFSWTRRGTRPLAVSGGVGAFRGVIPPARLASLFDATGLPTTSQQLECVGPATPIPDWSSTATAVPTACTDGVAPVEYSTAQPNVALFGSRFAAPVSWRASLKVGQLRIKGWRLGVNTTYSLGVNGESALDLNQRATPVFTLDNEGERPVFVSPSAIVPASGAIAPGAPRLTDRYLRVTRHVSDLRSHALQIGVTLAPPRPIMGKYPLNVSYMLSHQRLQSRHLGASGFGGPREKEWARGPQPTHQLQVASSGRLSWLTLAMRLNVSSGRFYTPIVASDVNGDGMAGDRAFVFSPGATQDPVLADQISSLLESAPSRARDCLREQLGRVARPNSCGTGWQFRPDVNLDLAPPSQFGFGDRLRLSAKLLNASGALFHVLGLSRQPLARFGALSPPDPTLLYVTGFDSSSRQYQYRVNQQFGEQRDLGSGAVGGRRFPSPFQIQLGAEYKFGGPSRNSLVRSLGLIVPRDSAPLTVEQAVARLRRFANNPVTLVLERRDTLRLDEAQVSALRTASAAFAAGADSALTPTAALVIERGRRLLDSELQRRLSRANGTLRALRSAALAAVRQMLSEEQVRRLPAVYSRLM